MLFMNFKKIKSLLIALVLLSVFQLQGCVKPSYKNPIITGMNPDPSIVRVDDTYYLVTSTFEYFPGLPIYKSKDLVHWKLISYAVSSKTANPLMGTPSSGGQYAATIRYQDGTFYVVGTNYAGRGDFYVTAQNPEGPWSEPVWVNNWFVDPSLLFADGKSYWVNPDHKGGFAVGEIDLKTGQFTKPLVTVASGQGGSSPEGPHLYKIDGYYYLLSAEGGTGYEHRAVIQRSKSPYGPFEPSPYNPMASNMNKPDSPIQAIGHADLVNTPDGWWMVCLGIRPKGGQYHHLGRETFLAPVTWTDDGWPVAGDQGTVQETYAAPQLPVQTWEPDPAIDNFDSDKLALVWNFLRNPHSEDWSLVERKGFLRLKGSSISLKEKDSPAYVARRQTGFNMQVKTKLTFNPQSDNEEAGILIRGNDKNHYDFVITRRNAKPVALLRQVLDGRTTSEQMIGVSEGEVTIKIVASELEYKFSISSDQGADELVGTALTKNLSTEKIQGFTGVFIGMYASGNGVSNANPADFDWFEYRDN